jgi:hypothetical protein
MARWRRGSRRWCSTAVTVLWQPTTGTAMSCSTRGDEGKVGGIHSTGDSLEAWLTETEWRQRHAPVA